MKALFLSCLVHSKASKVIRQPCVSGGYDFLSLDHLDFRWQIAVNGVIVETGKLEGFSRVPKGIWILRQFHLTNPRFHVYPCVPETQHRQASVFKLMVCKQFKCLQSLPPCRPLGCMCKLISDIWHRNAQKVSQIHLHRFARDTIGMCCFLMCAYMQTYTTECFWHTVQYVWVHELFSPFPGRTEPVVWGGGSHKRVQSVDACCISIFGAYFLIHT